MKELQQTLKRIDQKGYKAYNDIKGTHQFSSFALHIDHVQADPFASPSRIRASLSTAETGLTKDDYHEPHRYRACTDFFAREVARALKKEKADQGIMIDRPGQEILERTAVTINDDTVEIRLSLHLPAKGRTILGQQAASRLIETLPSVIQAAMYAYDRAALETHLKLSDQQAWVRSYLRSYNYTAFVANGAVLPRESGISEQPLKGDGLTPFQSPKEMEITLELPHGKTISGMAFREGVNVIVGGGYHGKSTLLEGLARGVYDHIEGDGREFVFANDDAVKVRAEDGRSVTDVNISPFISNLPNNKGTERFQTENASGSTSQAANIVEMVEAGAGTLFIDEDTSATNFMIRDGRMQALVHKDKEPITPFIDKVRHMYDDLGISTILVVGGAGDYFDVADCVVMMDEYQPREVTEKAKEIAASFGEKRTKEAGSSFGAVSARAVRPESFDARKGKKEKVDAKGKHRVLYGTTDIDLAFIEQIADPSQTRAIAQTMRYMAASVFDKQKTLSEALDEIEAAFDRDGVEAVSSFRRQHPGDMARPRRFELAAAINRLRTLKIQ
ncbi:putative ABC-class ATPase [Salsuginibacillus halophilus]|uniref:Putative ABC-class ATPase n=1 Tax=Salsuginibacillus halophilus TaxID=517424 RepID=A0A2P8HYK7_9BACI|nr:ABC-ATPase domain-containing protein [Salsuginibacillus halophilus]PSL51265.1 putative ABC-class ATPase [Salsuginibacillus halophilus]